MSPVRVGIDLAQIPLRVGGLMLGKFIVVEGSKGVRIYGSDPPEMEEVTAALNDARDVLKSYFGASDFDAAIVVVANSTSQALRQKMISGWQIGKVNITDMMDERLAVAVAYADKAKPTKNTKLVISSLAADILDVSVVSIFPQGEQAVEYTYLLHKEVADDQMSGSQSGGLIGAAIESLVDPIESAAGVLQNALSDLKKEEIDLDEKTVLVFVGKAARSEKLMQDAKDVFTTAVEVWPPDVNEAEDIAAFGAAVVSSCDAKLNVITPNQVTLPVDPKTLASGH